MLVIRSPEFAVGRERARCAERGRLQRRRRRRWPVARRYGARRRQTPRVTLIEYGSVDLPSHCREFHETVFDADQDQVHRHQQDPLHLPRSLPGRSATRHVALGRIPSRPLQQRDACAIFRPPRRHVPTATGHVRSGPRAKASEEKLVEIGGAAGLSRRNRHALASPIQSGAARMSRLGDSRRATASAARRLAASTVNAR